MTNPEKAPDPIDFQVQLITEDGEITEVTDVTSDTTVRPVPESRRKHLIKYLQPPYTDQPLPPARPEEPPRDNPPS